MISENPLLSSLDYMEERRRLYCIEVTKSNRDGATALGAQVEDVLVHVQTVGVQTAQEGNRPLFWRLGGRKRSTVGLVVEFLVKRLGVRKNEESNGVCELDETAPCVAAIEKRNGIELETVRMHGGRTILVKRIGNHRKRAHQLIHVGLNQIVVDVVVEDQFAIGTKVQTHLPLLMDLQKGQHAVSNHGKGRYQKDNDSFLLRQLRIVPIG